MFHYQVASLPIEFTGLSFRDINQIFPDLELDQTVDYNPQRKLADYLHIEDVCTPCPKGISYFNPSFYLRGRYIQGSYHNQIFQIDPEGPHMLMITGRPTEMDIDEATKFRLKDTIYRYYWEDGRFGYLTQVVEYHPAKLYQLKTDQFITL